MRIVIADDAVLLREGAARLLEDAGHEVVAQAGDADDLLRKVRAHKPDVAIIDVRMPPDNTDDGLRAALTLRSEMPGLGVLLLLLPRGVFGGLHIAFNHIPDPKTDK